MKRLLCFFLASCAAAQNYTSYTTGGNTYPVARTSWLRNQGYNGKNVLGDSSLLVYLPMTDCNAGPFNDLSNNGVVATLSGTYQNNSQRGKTGACAPYFNKSVPNKYAVTPTPTVTVPFTVTAWCIPNNPTVVSQFPRVLETYYSTGLYLGGSNTTKWIATVKNTFSTAAGTLNVGAWPNGAWTMLSQTYDGTNILFYINGALQNTTAAASPGTQTITMEIGYCSTAGSSGCSSSAGAWDGQIQDVRVYNRVLPAAELLAIYTAENH